MDPLLPHMDELRKISMGSVIEYFLMELLTIKDEC